MIKIKWLSKILRLFKRIEDDIYVTSQGSFGMKSEDIFKDTEQSLKTLDKLNKIIKINK